MEKNTLSLTLAVLLGALAPGCGSKPDMGSMSRADQEKAFKGDPAKIQEEMQKEKAAHPVPAGPDGIQPQPAATGQ